MLIQNRRFLLCAATLVLALASPVSAQSVVDSKNDVSEAKQLTAEANRWLDNAGDAGLVLVKEESGTGFVKQSGLQFRYKSGDYAVSIGMDGDIAAEDLTLDILRTRFSFFVIDSLPLPGFQDLEGWEVIPRTPVSSFSEGVEFVSFADGKVSLRVKTSFFAIYGIDTRVLVPADAPSPKGSFFSVRRPFSLDLTLTATIS